jgi:serine/threonine protein kinase
MTYSFLAFRADGGDLFQLLVSKGAMVEESARTMFRQILLAVEYLHSKSIVHRDLKPENILLTRDGTAKLSDFGLARMLDAAAALKTLCGTPQYVAPEIITLGSVGPSNALNGYSHAVDMWSLGVILYIMLSGEPPFDTELNPTMSLYQQIETGTYEFPADLWDPVSPSAKDILVHLLEVDPNKRLTVSQALHHPWLTGRTTESSTSSQSRGNADARGGFSQEDDDLPENRRLKKRKTESLLNGAFEEKLSLTNRPTSKEQVDMIQDDNKRRKVNQAEKEVAVVSASN